MKKSLAPVLSFLVLASSALAAGTSFSAKPVVKKTGETYTISFAISQPTDVEVAVLSGANVVRHLAAGVLGGTNAPPEPLQPGLAQSLVWDGKDDFGVRVAAPPPSTSHPPPLRVRVRAGLGIKFNRLIGAEPYNLGKINGIATDEDGNVYVSAGEGVQGQGHMVTRVFDLEGKYLREVLPFPANLPPNAMKDVARWDEERQTFFLRNLRNLNPNFYRPGAPKDPAAVTLPVIAVSKKGGIVFSDGATLYALDGAGAVKGDKFQSISLGWVRNTGGGPNAVTLSPDGKYAYLSGPFSIKNIYGHQYEPAYPPGRVYRVPLDGAGKLAEFITIPVDHKEGNGGNWEKSIPQAGRGHYTTPHGPVHYTAVDAKGNVYVTDREHNCVAVFDDAGKALGRVAVDNPHAIAVHPQTGAIYVTEHTCVSYGVYSCIVNKFDNYQEGAKPVARYEFKPGWHARHSVALAVGKDKSVLWLGGIAGSVVALEDKGATFEPVPLKFAPSTDVPTDWNRLAVDYGRDEVYVSDGLNRMWRFDGATGSGSRLKKNGKDFLANDLAVGYDGLLYVCVSGNWDGSAPDYSGPYWRLDRELNPAPFKGTETHVLSPYIYSRMGIGYAERGLGVGPDGSSYIAFMYKWVAYAIGGFDGDGRPLKGKYLQDVFPSGNEKKKYPEGWNSAIIGPVPQMTANIRVDLRGNLYVGMMTRAKDFAPPKGFERDQGYRVSVGSVVKFDPKEGGSMPFDPKIASPGDGSEGAFKCNDMKGVLRYYPGLAPFSSAMEGFGGNTCCVCRVPRFDLDRYGRLLIPNAITHSVLLYDNAGNLIAEFGKYGNFDSQYVNPNAAAGKGGGSAGSAQFAPSVAVPEIPLAWPTGAGFSEKALYVNDTYNRRVVRLEMAYAAEEMGVVE